MHYGAVIHTRCLMSSHYYLLLQTPSGNHEAYQWRIHDKFQYQAEESGQRAICSRGDIRKYLPRLWREK
jgi:hypothetical protein